MILEKRVDLLDLRGQADQVEMGPSQQRGGIGRSVRRQSLFLEPFKNEGIDGMLGPRALGGRVIDWLNVGPVGLGPFIYDGITKILLFLMVVSDLVFRIKGKTPLDPFGEGGDLVVRKLADGGHLVVLVLVGDHFKNQARFRLLEVHGWSDFTSVEDALARTENQIPLDFLLCSVALPTIFLKKGVDLFLPEG